MAEGSNTAKDKIMYCLFFCVACLWNHLRGSKRQKTLKHHHRRVDPSALLFHTICFNGMWSTPSPPFPASGRCKLLTWWGSNTESLMYFRKCQNTLSSNTRLSLKLPCVFVTKHGYQRFVVFPSWQKVTLTLMHASRGRYSLRENSRGLG